MKPLRSHRRAALDVLACALLAVFPLRAQAQSSADDPLGPDPDLDDTPSAEARPPEETPTPALSSLDEPAAPAPTTDNASELLARAEEAMTTLDYARTRDLGERAITVGGLSREELTRALRLIAVACAQLGDDAAARPAFLRLFALDADTSIAARLAPARRSAVLEARGFWSVHKDAFQLDVSYARRERQIVVHVDDAGLGWARTLHVWSRYNNRPYVKAQRMVGPELTFPVEDVEPTDPLEVYAFVTDEHGNVLMELGRAHDPHVFDLTDAELATILRRDIRGGQVGSYARRLEELDVQVGVHGYASLEFKPVNDTPSFDLHHATAMIRANLHRTASLEIALEWEHLGLEQDDFYLPHAFLDIELSELLIIRGGFFEVPVGAFNEYLYPDFLRITGQAPLFSTGVVPALWSEVGVQLRGRLDLVGDSRLTYAVFVGNGLEQKDSEPEDGMPTEGGNIQSMRFNARDRFNANKAVGGRLGLEVEELDFGVSGYTGRYTIESDQQLSMADIDMSLRGEWLTVRTEGAIAFEDTDQKMLRKYGLYALVAVRPIAYLEPYAEYDFVELDPAKQRALLGLAFYPVPNERATRNLRLKSEAGYELPEAGGKDFVWFFQLTTGF